MNSRVSNLVSNPMAYITILILVSLVFNGLIFISLQLTFLDNKDQANRTSEIRNAQIKEIQAEQNQTQELLPIFFRQFNQTDLLVNLTNQVLNNTAESRNAANETRVLIKFLVDNFGSQSGYLEAENFQYGQANKTYVYLQQSLTNQEKIIGMLLNQTN